MPNSDQLSPEDERIIDLFFLLKEGEKFMEAFDVLYPLAEKYPDKFVIFFLLGSVLYECGEFKNAEGYLEKAVSLNPAHWLSSMTLIHTLSNLKKWHTAFNEIRRFLLEKNGNKKEHMLLLRELHEGIDSFSTSERALISDLIKKFKI
ncbi:tetratricopeptide repeat protein [Niastella sp. OAS944]|uniref:tetratricopeptide repeat protein n=1 Tax=Niastella sp. OAS944 TaxID=2664089 RepID=UPI0034831E10|nr:tetratricopeptide (TPR) repeat protein [Chitinophagaceae bacterium OAS944]